MATYVIFSNAGERTQSIASTWTATRNGTGSISYSINAGASNIWRQDDTGNWLAQMAYTGFDTSVLDTDEHITGAGIRFHTVGTNTNHYISNVRKASSIPGTAAWVAGANLSSMPFLGRGRFGPATGTAVGIDVTQLNRTADTYILTYPQEIEVSSNPSGHWTGSGLAGWNNSTGDGRPRIFVHTLPPSTIDGAVDASVQLSDGSTVFLERTAQSLAASSLALKRTDTSGTTTVLDSAAGATTWAPNSATLVCDANDNIVTFLADNTKLHGFRYLASDSWTTRQAWETSGSLNDQVVDGSFKDQAVAAVFCDKDGGTDGLGRVLVIATDQERGSFGFYILDVSNLLNQTSVPIFDKGVNPGWLRVSAVYSNVSGAGLSLATDVFGGTRVVTAAWQTNALLTNLATVTYATRFSVIDVGEFVAWQTAFTPDTGSTTTTLRRTKVVGVGPNRFVVAQHVGSTVYFRSINDTSLEHSNSFVLGLEWELVHYRDAAWFYYWSSNALRRIPYFYETNNTGWFVLVNDFGGTGTRNALRAPKMVRFPHHVEVHHNLTEA